MTPRLLEFLREFAGEPDHTGYGSAGRPPFNYRCDAAPAPMLPPAPPSEPLPTGEAEPSPPPADSGYVCIATDFVYSRIGNHRTKAPWRVKIKAPCGCVVFYRVDDCVIQDEVTEAAMCDDSSTCVLDWGRSLQCAALFLEAKKW